MTLKYLGFCAGTEFIGGTAGTIDPLGSTIESGPELYFTLLRNMAASFNSCLVQARPDRNE